MDSDSPARVNFDISRGTSSFLALIAYEAPKRFARSSFFSSTSTAYTSAPKKAAIWTIWTPTPPPAPITMTLSSDVKGSCDCIRDYGSAFVVDFLARELEEVRLWERNEFGEPAVYPRSHVTSKVLADRLPVGEAVPTPPTC